MRPSWIWNFSTGCGASTAPRSYTLTVRRAFTPTAPAGASAGAENSNCFLYNFLLCDDGVLLPNRNGEGSGLTIHRHTFLRDDEAEIVEWDKSNWDGMWQNALGETIVINSSLMQYIACSPDYSMSGTMDDEGEGMGLYLYDNGTRAYLCPGDDGNSFTLSAERFGRYGDDQHFDGVFYRNADFYAYTDMENAEFYEDEYSTFYIWY